MCWLLYVIQKQLMITGTLKWKDSVTIQNVHTRVRSIGTSAMDRAPTRFSSAITLLTFAYHCLDSFFFTAVTDYSCFEVEADKRLAETERPTKALVLHPARHMCNDMIMLMCLFSSGIC